MKSDSFFNDIRLDRVQNSLVNAMVDRQSVIIHQLSKDRNQEVSFHRFLENKKVTPQNIIECFNQSNPIDYSGKHLLMIQDTSDLSFDFNANRGHLGYIAPNTDKTGFRLHPCIVLDADHGGCYQLACSEFHYTDYESTIARIAAGEKKPLNYTVPFNEKQSYRWYSSAKTAIENSVGASTYTIVADREGDIYDSICRFKENQWDYLIRSSGNRKVETENGEVMTLPEQLKRWEIEFNYELTLKKTDKRTAHRAKLKVKFGKTKILRPSNHIDKNLPEKQEIYVIEVSECPSTVVGKEKPIHWILLTSHPITSKELALYFIQCYCWRWVIEQVFRALKSKGLDIENSQLEKPEKIEKQTVLALIAAIQVLQLVQSRDGQTDQKIDTVFTKIEIECLKKLNPTLEGKTEKQKNPHSPESLAFASWIIARLGGWKGYKGKARPPGPITMKNGLVRFYSILQGYYLLL